MVANFWCATWAIHSHRSFLVSDLSDLLTSVIKKEGMSKLLVFFFLRTKNIPKNTILVKCFERIAHLLIYHERPERIAHGCSMFICYERLKRFDLGCSFDMSYLSNSLTVAHFILVIWANECMSDERMSKFLAPPSGGIHKLSYFQCTVVSAILMST